MDSTKDSDRSKLEKRQETERRYRQNQKNRAISQPTQFSFDDFILCLILTLTLLLWDVLRNII